MKNADIHLLIARLCLAAIFIYSGVTKLVGWEGALAEFSGLGLPFPALAVLATIAVQLAGGLAVASGYGARTAALVLAGFTIVATMIGHPFWRFEGEDFHRQLTVALEHLAIVGGFLLLAARGPGALSLGRS
ncbi:DoxX family protein [Parvibaculum lavamentivorans DS-1]|uniref:DoxX family protein n=1 Tax=Parvibaculum lavamentivorans (strain DS-1 / DSM 13023 / NCIMB 13966) TaxID=402881 RepID=A7HVR2_PARL1|nr:DoxX family protein [Parvibaculum lavamentivorans]ABS63995.1 DoxX family protein [Parvibaculum lavamentivorans DS-1]